MKPGKGRIVHYTLADYDLSERFHMQAGRVRPAMIVETWGNETSHAIEMGSAVNLQVFTDGANDGIPGGVLWKTSVLHAESPKPGCWSWPPRE